jgi:putative flippase GtrA
VGRSFLRGGGKVDLGDHRRAPLRDDMGRQLVSFIAVGALSTAVSLGLFLVLHSFMHPIAANVVALAATAVANAWANRRFTFGHRSRVDRARHYVAAASMLLTAIAVSTAALAITLWAGGGIVAQSLTLIVAWALTAVGRFALLRAWVFRDPPAELSGRTVITRT